MHWLSIEFHFYFPLFVENVQYTHVPDFQIPMHFLHFLLLGLTISSSAQLASQPADDPSTAVPEIASSNNAEIEFDAKDDGVVDAIFGSDRPEALFISQKGDSKSCSSNGNNQRPPKRRLRAREWCRNNQYELAPSNPPAIDIKPPASVLPEGEPKDESAADGNLNQPSAKPDIMGRPRPSKPLELPPIPGRTPSFRELDPDPCKEERTYAVCSPLEPTTTWFPLSLIWAPGSLEYCRLCTSFSSSPLRPFFFLSELSL